MDIKDIAKLSQVSVSTVSRVINNHPDVKYETRERILEVIKQTNYIPNNSARILKKNNDKSIGILVKGVYNPFFSEMVKIMSDKIKQANYTMILQYYDQKSKEDVNALITFIKEKKLQGVICLGGDFTDISDDNFKGLDVSVVLTSVTNISKTAFNKFSSIGIEDEKSAYKATEYLIKNGHRTILLIIGSYEDIGAGKLRVDGYRQALNNYGLCYDEELVAIGDYSFDKAYNATIDILKNRKDITAIFAISDIMAIGAAKAVINSGYRIGDDISIMGFDGMEMGKYYNPSITTIYQPKTKMANMSVELLLSLMNKKGKNKHITLDTKLVEGESCKPI
ncbi:Catabolite control protein A [Clostridium liquoris]|jgi:LacI family transcriptional regulator|uniref:Catabolite control protein A n=1 Tax=Clostridium liquoris TaxID=1289519 RepID=A0A2T0B1W6_9CLOT|nr:LacI family DNA-binding transcriptional regulator [Clostridium liquoris]PRR77806.1 Catabolite control protein A [Clostridium liquoris]